jgi:RNA polymerase sigma factor (sigma-70 family)
MDSHLSRCDTSELVRSLFSRPREALDEFVRRHLPRMHLIARSELKRRSVPEAFYDEDDLVSSSNRLFFSLILAGKVHSIKGLDELWVVYRRIAASRVRAAGDRLRAKKRGFLGRWNARPLHDAGGYAAVSHDRFDPDDVLNLFESGLARPEVTAIADDTLRLLLELLNDDQQRIANLRLDTLSIADIAKQLGTSERTISRRLEEIREIWRSSGEIDGL